MVDDDHLSSFDDDANKTATQYLDKQGVDPRFYSEPFLEASELGDPTSLRQRLAMISADEKRQLVKSVDQQGCTGLLLCAKRGDTEMVDILLDAGSIVNDSDTSGITALHYAAGKGSSAMVKSLLAFGANVAAKDERSECPLMWANGAGAVESLIEARADVNAVNIDGDSALIIASRKGDEDSIRILARLPDIDLDLCDSQGRSAHATAIKNGHLEAAELLISLGAKSNEKPSSRIVRNVDAFLNAARRGEASSCADFLREGVDVEAEVGGETALLLAAGASCGKAVETLLSGRADPNHADPFMSETPLIRAVLSQSSNELLWMLLEAKADPAAQDVGGRTAADVAHAWGNREATDILKAAAAGELKLGALD